MRLRLVAGLLWVGLMSCAPKDSCRLLVKDESDGLRLAKGYPGEARVFTPLDNLVVATLRSGTLPEGTLLAGEGRLLTGTPTTTGTASFSLELVARDDSCSPWVLAAQVEVKAADCDADAACRVLSAGDCTASSQCPPTSLETFQCVPIVAATGRCAGVAGGGVLCGAGTVTGTIDSVEGTSFSTCFFDTRLVCKAHLCSQPG